MPPESKNVAGMKIGDKFYTDAQIATWMNDANEQLVNYYARKKPIGTAHVNGKSVPIYEKMQ